MMATCGSHPYQGTERNFCKVEAVFEQGDDRPGAARSHGSSRAARGQNMRNVIKELTSERPKAVFHDAYGCACYQAMGMSPTRTGRFILLLLTADCWRGRGFGQESGTHRHEPTAPGYRALTRSSEELTMKHSFPKQAFLEDLRVRNMANLELVQETLVPLDRAARTAQPELGEWCVDQCLQHLVLGFEMHLAHLLPVLERDRGVDTAATFTRSWMARRNLYQKQFDPRTKIQTLPRVTPTHHYYPDVYGQFAAQKARFEKILGQARQFNLQRRGWFLWVVPINVGDFLEMFVQHDELHIDQALRALAAYRQYAS